MTITISEIEAELQTELLTCSECHIPTRTLPAENLPAQALRYGINCEHVFWMELPRLHLANAFKPMNQKRRAARLGSAPNKQQFWKLPSQKDKTAPMLLIPEVNINSQTMIDQNPHFYEYGKNSAVIDAELARQRLDALNKRNGPRVGNFVRFPDEDKPRRFTYDWNDGAIQTTIKGSNDSSFHITRSGYCDFSGSLDSPIWLDQCHDTGEKLLGWVWFFSRNLSGAHRGINVKLPFRVFQYRPVKQICPNCQHEDCEAIRFCDRCNMRVCQGCFDEHVLDFPCHVCNTYPERNEQGELTGKGCAC